MTVGDFLLTALAAAAGSSVLIGLLAWLGQSLIGHWLAKAVVKYTAQVETDEHRKRVPFERHYTQRSEAVDRLMKKASECTTIVHGVVSKDGLSTNDDVSVAYLARYREIHTSVFAVMQEVTSVAHLFEKDEPLPRFLCQWLAEVLQQSNRFYDDVISATDTEFYLKGSEIVRWAKLDQLRRTHLGHRSDVFEAFLARCRELSGTGNSPRDR